MADDWGRWTTIMAPAAEAKTLKIDGTGISARTDQTILEPTRENNIAIPTLYHPDGLSDVGACRMCLVEVAGTTRLVEMENRLGTLISCLAI